MNRHTLHVERGAVNILAKFCSCVQRIELADGTWNFLVVVFQTKIVGGNSGATVYMEAESIDSAPWEWWLVRGLAKTSSFWLQTALRLRID